MRATQLLEQGVAQRTRELTQLVNVAQTITSTLDLETLIQSVIETLKVVVDFDTAEVFLGNLDSGLRLVSQVGDIFPSGLLVDRNIVEGTPLTDLFATQKQPLIVRDILENTPAGLSVRQTMTRLGKPYEHLRSWMIVPLVARGAISGILTLQHALPNRYSAHDAKLAMTFANQVAIAIENIRLKDAAVLAATMAERSRIARELHDSVSQALFGIVLGLRTTQQLQARGKFQELSGSIDYTYALAEGALAEMRALIFELRPESLHQEGLLGALRKQCTALLARFKIAAEVHLCEEPSLSLQSKEALYRIAMEALQNVVKHAKANSVRLELKFVAVSLPVGDRPLVCLQISDNGIGFDPKGSFPGHFGLATMRERVALFGGSLELQSVIGQGTQITVCLPAES